MSIFIFVFLDIIFFSKDWSLKSGKKIQFSTDLNIIYDHTRYLCKESLKEELCLLKNQYAAEVLTFS